MRAGEEEEGRDDGRAEGREDERSWRGALPHRTRFDGENIRHSHKNRGWYEKQEISSSPRARATPRRHHRPLGAARRPKAPPSHVQYRLAQSVALKE